MAEFEVKFLIHDEAQVDRLVAHFQSGNLEFHARPTVEITDRYFDTPNWQLLDSGWSYRWRDESGRLTVGLKSVAGGPGLVQIRQEVDQDVAAFPDAGHHLPDGSVARQLRGIDRNSLRELFTVQNRRRLYDLRIADGSRIELAIDQVRITGAEPRRNDEPNCLEFNELELELKDGHEDSLRQLAKMLQHQFELMRSRSSKFARGIKAAGWSPPMMAGDPPEQIPDTASLRDLCQQQLTADDAVSRLACRCLFDACESMLTQESTAMEGRDTEGVHQMRVSTRRIRAGLRAFRKHVAPGLEKLWSPEFKWFADVLGNVRDLDVYLCNLEHHLTTIPADDAAALGEYREDLLGRWKNARQDLVDCLAGPRYQHLRNGFAGSLRDGLSGVAEKSGRSKTIRRAARRLFAAQYRNVIRTGRTITPDSANDTLHALRIECKRLRYLFEFFHPIYGKSFNPFIRKLKKLQNVLGSFQDACVATERTRQFAGEVAMRPENRDLLIAIGQMIRIHSVQAADCRDRFRDVWSRFDQKGQRKRMLAMLK
jgi:CHAD domain-containing protein/uncharacterized protein YjbK